MFSLQSYAFRFEKFHIVSFMRSMFELLDFNMFQHMFQHMFQPCFNEVRLLLIGRLNSIAMASLGSVSLGLLAEAKTGFERFQCDFSTFLWAGDL